MKTKMTADQVRRELAAADPAAQITDLDLVQSRARSLESMHSLAAQARESDDVPLLSWGGTTKKSSPRSSHPRPVLRRAVLLAAAAAVLTGGLVATDAINILGSTPATAEAVEALNSAAQQTINSSDPVLGPGQFLKVETTAAYADEGLGSAGRLFWLESQDRQLYVPADRDAQWIMNFEASRPVSYFGEATESEVLKIEARTPKGGNEYGDLRQVDAPWSEAELAALPLDPGKLLETIREQGRNSDNEAFTWISDRLRTGVIPAALRAALYRAAALIPGVTLGDHQAALDGRTGIAIGKTDTKDRTRREMIVDPNNGQFIGERVLNLDGYGAIPAGSATAWTSVKTSVVDTAPTLTP